MCSLMCLVFLSENMEAASKNVIYLGYAKKAWRNEVTGFDTLDREEYLDDIANSYTFDDPNAVVYRKSCISSFSDLETMLHNGNYVFINTHGSYGGNLCLYNSQGYPCGEIEAADFSTTTKKEYSNVKCCVIMACYSANGSSNICKNIYNHGAKCVVGFDQPVLLEYTTLWQYYFSNAQGAARWDVGQCVRYANNKIYRESGEDHFTEYKIYGDDTVVYGK